MEWKKKTQEILTLFHKYGHLEYGEHITQLSHAVQAGLIAKERGLDEELILAAFLHDIGHLYPLELMDVEIRQMGDFGIEAHDRWGEIFLKERGFSGRMIAVVKNHVAAKRYLCYADSDYYNQLSAASRKTLRYQGGPMTQEEGSAFESDPFFEDSVLLRKTDEEAKESEFEVSEAHLSYFADLLNQYT